MDEETRSIIDTRNMYKDMQNFPKQIEEATLLGKEISFDDVNRIFVAGMGGSALAGDILKSYMDDSFFPVKVIKGYTLPQYVDENSLVFVISYSGNTEETVECYRQAIRKNSKVVALGAGGKLEEIAKKLNRPFIKVKSGMEPRMGYALTFIPLLNVLYNSGVIENPEKDIKSTIKAMKKEVFEEKAKELAKKLDGKIPLIYSSSKLEIVSYKWKINFNENAKIHAFYNVYSEMNHNELSGFENAIGDFYVIILQDEEDNRRIKKRFKITTEQIKDKGYNVTLINITGECLLSRMFSAFRIGDFTAYYLAMHYKQDPSPHEMIDTLKKKMS